jgi:hypothetical protein
VYRPHTPDKEVLMHRFIVASVIAVSLAAAGAAQAGGWATVGMAPAPDKIEVGETWVAEITVLRHGVTPTNGARPTLTIRDTQSDTARRFDAKPTGRIGVYEAPVVFPAAGRWSVAVDNGLAATGYGSSATTTFGSVNVEPGNGGATGGFRVVPLGALLGALVLAAIGVLGVRRLRKMPATSH